VDAYLFEDIMEVRIIAEEWMDDCNNKRSDENLGGVQPVKYAGNFSSKGLAPLI
jgi:putative transposase